MFFLICALKGGLAGGLFKENRAFAKCRECLNFHIYGIFTPFLDGFSSKWKHFFLIFGKKTCSVTIFVAVMTQKQDKTAITSRDIQFLVIFGVRAQFSD